MRESIRDFVQLCAATLPVNEPIYEFGSLQVEGQEGFADLRPLFPGKQYIGADMREGKGVDVILNLHAIDLPEASAGTVLTLDTMEHVEYPRKAMDELYRILKPTGILVMSSVMNFPIHDYPYDYWRFTPEAFRSLLKPFENVVVEIAGVSDFPHTVVGIGMKRPVPHNVCEAFQAGLVEWRATWSKPKPRGLRKMFTIPAKYRRK